MDQAGLKSREQRIQGLAIERWDSRSVSTDHLLGSVSTFVIGDTESNVGKSTRIGKPTKVQACLFLTDLS